ncbi:MAG TPA: UpxY family transcription antiterminator [Flavisolibacter sp.]|nr:UpxY family transcription antiterminator [Flavisolibacter sp.]
MKPSSSWYAVYTKPKWEKKVAELLTRKKIENYCPLNKVRKQWHDRKKLVEEPLFTSYVFVCVSAAEFTEVRKTDGILNFVYWLGKPAAIREEEIIAIKRFLGEHGAVHLEKTRVRVNDQVQVTHGPLMHKEGTVLEVHRKTIKVLLPSLGYALVAQVEKTSVEVLNPVESREEAKNHLASLADVSK